MQVTFTKWCVDPKGRTQVSVDPTRVDCTEHFCDARVSRWEGDDDSVYPLCAGTRVVMRNKQEFLVQGKLDDVVLLLNAAQIAGQ